MHGYVRSVMSNVLSKASPVSQSIRVSALVILQIVVLVSAALSWNCVARVMPEIHEPDSPPPNSVRSASESAPLAEDAKAFKKFKLLMGRAKEHTVRTLPNETFQSYPIPVIGPTGMQVGFFWGTSRAVPGQGRHYVVPSWIAALDPLTGAVVDARRVLAVEFNQAAAGDFIGIHKQTMSVEQHQSLESRLYELYDLLSPVFAARNTVDTPELRDAAAEFQQVFGQLTDDFLHPYYRAMGREFFDWLDSAAERK